MCRRTRKMFPPKRFWSSYISSAHSLSENSRTEYGRYIYVYIQYPRNMGNETWERKYYNHPEPKTKSETRERPHLRIVVRVRVGGVRIEYF